MRQVQPFPHPQLLGGAPARANYDDSSGGADDRGSGAGGAREAGNLAIQLLYYSIGGSLLSSFKNDGCRSCCCSTTAAKNN